MKNGLDEQYINLLKDILENGVIKETRNGKTLSVFGRSIRYKFEDGKFPLLTTKRMSFKTIATELLWFLRGDTNIKYLVDNGCHIWNGDAYKNYYKFCIDTKWMEPVKKELNGEVYDMGRKYDQEGFINRIKTDDEFAKKWGELGSIYGKQWRRWERNTTRDEKIVEPGVYTKQIDQIQNLINELKTNPDSRRLMVNAWNVGELDQMVLPPCHYGFQVYTRELSLEDRIQFYYKRDCGNGKLMPDKILKEELKSERTVKMLDKLNIPTRAISLMWNQRSVDTFLGLPFNIASYGLLLEIIAKEVNMVSEELIGNLGDVHLYSNHIEQAREQIGGKLSLSERREMVTQEMFNQIYNAGGPETLSHSEIDQWYIPRIKTREPFPLPTFDCPAMDEIPHITFDELVFKLQPCDFYMDDYQSHPAIKAPLSN